MFALALSMASFSQLSIGIQGTGNLASAQVKGPEDLDFRKKMKSMPGGGIVVQYDLARGFALRSGVNYLQNGVTLEALLDETVDLKIRVENRLNYLQVPLNLVYSLPITKLNLFVGAGGFVNYGISGTSKATTSYTMPDGHQAIVIEKSKAFKKQDDGGAGLRKTDWGVAALAGVRLSSGVFVNAGYQLSLGNIADPADDIKYRNRGLQITIGYFFR